MMMTCSRCEKEFDGFRQDCGNGHFITEGYYDARQWKAFCDKEEKVICDKCMHTDKRYQAVYGKHKGVK
jgi:hypothetical protein